VAIWLSDIVDIEWRRQRSCCISSRLIEISHRSRVSAFN